MLKIIIQKKSTDNWLSHCKTEKKVTIGLKSNLLTNTKFRCNFAMRIK